MMYIPLWPTGNPNIKQAKIIIICFSPDDKLYRDSFLCGESASTRILPSLLIEMCFLSSPIPKKSLTVFKNAVIGVLTFSFSRSISCACDAISLMRLNSIFINKKSIVTPWPPLRSSCCIFSKVDRYFLKKFSTRLLVSSFHSPRECNVLIYSERFFSMFESVFSS